MALAVAEALETAAPAAPSTSLLPLSDALEASMGQRGVLAMLLNLLSLLTLAIAAVGLYGVVSRSVAGRTREIGIRMAPGARAAAVAGTIYRRVLGITGLGIALGFGAAGILARVLRNQLFGVSPADPVAYAVGAALFAGVALLAAVVPVHNATRVDPARTLRDN